MKFLAAILISTQLLGIPSPALAEDGDFYFARVWQSDDGLPENRVVGVVQSPDGFLWVATQGGMVRFDGVRFQRVSVAGSPELIAGTMRVLLLDRFGRIWLAKEEGDTLFCFEGAQVRMVTAAQGLPKNDRQSSMAVDGEGSLWIAYSSGKVIRYGSDGKVESFTSAEGLPGGNAICWLASGRDGVLWFARGKQVGVFRNGRFKVLSSDLGRISPLEGNLTYTIQSTALYLFLQGKTLKLKSYILDRALHKSNVIESEDFAIR